MHCTQCGKEIPQASRFCPSCGASVETAAGFGSVPPPSGTYSTRAARLRPELLRPRSGRMVAGVCAAFARTYGWNLTLTRVLLVVLTPFHLGLGFIAYLAAWIIIPEEPYLLPPERL